MGTLLLTYLFAGIPTHLNICFSVKGRGDGLGNNRLLLIIVGLSEGQILGSLVVS